MPLLASLTPATEAGRVCEITEFGTNPGALRMFVYAPTKRLPAGAPLIVVMHGCGQNAGSFAANAGWIALAERIGVALLLPEQKTENNRGRCFNWYQPDDVRRGKGEAMSVRQMVRAATKRYTSDRRRIFIVGLSAGGAMAAALLAAYPAVFAGGAVVAGMPVGSAGNLLAAMMRSYRADPYKSRAALADSVRNAAPSRTRRSWPRLSIWQGGKDRVINPANAEMLAAQWSELHGFAEAPTSESILGPGVRRRVWGTAKRPAVEIWTLADMAHGFPVDLKVAGTGSTGIGVLDAGVSAAEEIAGFWELETRANHVSTETSERVNLL